MQVNNHFKKIFILFRSIGVQLSQWYNELPRSRKIAFWVIILCLIGLAVVLWPKKAEIPEVAEAPRTVEVGSVGDLSNDVAPLPLVGVVSSVNEAVLRAEASGEVRVYKSLGDRVSVGTVIGEFENASQRAVVLQTQGAYESAKAARDIALINSATTNNTMGDTKTNGLNAINSAYATFDDVIRAKTDTAFNDPRTINPTLKALNTDSLLANKVINERKDIEEMLLERTIKNSQVTVDSDLESYLNSEIQEAQTIKAYLDDLATIYVKALPSSDYPQSAIDAQKAVISASRSTISGTITSLTSTKVAWINALASQKIAGRTTGDSNPSTAASDAQVKTALGAYNGALANLEKTIIRSPINGTLNSLGIKTGDFVNQTSQVAVVSNNGALEIVAYVSEDDAKRITPGADVTINDGIKGKVTKVASAVDPVTKKIQVKVGIVDENTELINGESVKISVKNVVTKAVASGDIKIPLSAVKITPRGNYVFILSATSSLISVPVELGALLGDQVEIKTGLSGDMQIIKDARGLKEGEVVEALIK